MKRKLLAVLIAAALAPAAVYAQTTPAPRTSGQAAESAEKRIEREHKAAKEACKPLKGNAQDVCKKEADAKEKIAKAELKVQKKDTPENRRELAETKAKAEYDVAKERCEDQKGDAKQMCERDAKSKRDSALAAAKGSKDRPAATTAARDTGTTKAARKDKDGSPDSVITGKIKTGFVKDKIVRSRNYNVDTAGGVVTVRGKARTQAEADRAMEIAKNTQGVVSVKNEIQVMPAADRRASTDAPKRDTRAAAGTSPQQPRDPVAKADAKKAGDMSASTSTSAKGGTTAQTSTKEGSGSPDALITTKIKAEYAMDKAVSATNIKVETNAGVVTLSGTAKSKAEADRAVQLARNVKDVKSVKNEIKVEPAK